MEDKNLRITPVTYDFPWDLFLMADPSRQAISKYLEIGQTFLARREGQIVGGYIIVENQPSVFELMNIAVYPQFQQQGIGTNMLKALIAELQGRGATKLEVGTGTFGYQLTFYQRLGFRVEAIDKDFFLNNYAEPIMEDGIRHKDMLRLVLKL